jgi:short-subunit dehydrogenase
LVLGASSGVGRTIARQYAERGANVCIVGRREALIKEVERECRDARSLSTLKIEKDSVLSIPADFTNVEDMVRLREILDESMLSYIRTYFFL